MHKPETWVLVADATRARVLRQPEPAPRMHTPPLETIFTKKTRVLPARAIMSDEPGRSFSSVGEGRSAMEYRSDPVREELREFVREILDELDKRRERGEFQHLVIHAPPRMLGELRDLMSPHLAATVVAEFDKDLTKLPERDLREALLAEERPDDTDQPEVH